MIYIKTPAQVLIRQIRSVEVEISVALFASDVITIEFLKKE